MNFTEIVLNVPRIRSLVWRDETLFDWACGGKRIELNGAVHAPGVHFGSRFDAALASPSGRFVAVFEKLGTKALILDQGEVVRELNRSYYFSDVYEYPIGLLRLPDGRECVAHCPVKYCRIDLDEIESGRCLTSHVARDHEEVFHSRLATSPGGLRLASAGWIWHPFGVARAWSVEAALLDPGVLDRRGIPIEASGEVESVAFLADSRLALATGLENIDGEPTKPTLSILDLPTGSLVSRAYPSTQMGTLVRFDADHVLALYEHPRLLHVADGSVVHEWPHLPTGNQDSSIVHGIGPIPPFAMHPSLPMFAVAHPDRVTVVRL